MGKDIQSEEEKQSSVVRKGKTPAFTAYEKELLLDLVDSFKDDVECKTDPMTVIKKQKAWKKITDQFNSDATTTKRTTKQLTKSWDNRKTTAKKKITAKKNSTRRTGGGPSSQTLSPDIERVCAMIPEQLHSLKNQYDCDEVLEIELQPPFNINDKSPHSVDKEGADQEANPTLRIG